MARTKDIVDMILKGCTVREIQEEHHLPPSHLRRIIRSRGFREYIQLQRELTRTFVILGSAEHAYYALEKLAEVMDAAKIESIRKASTTLLRHGLSETPFCLPISGMKGQMPDSIGQNPSETVKNSKNL